MSASIPSVLSTAVARDWTWTRSYLVHVPGGAAVLVDPATISREEREHLRGALLSHLDGATVAAVFLTHGHPDHILDARYWASELEAPIAAHPADLPLMEDPVLNGSTAFGHEISLEGGIDLELYDGMALELAEGVSLEVLHLPGHSPGSCGLYYPGNGGGSFLICGDLLFRGSIGTDSLPGFGPLWKASLEREIETIRERVLTLPGETVVHPGHGPSTTVLEEERNNPFLSSRGLCAPG